MATTYNHYIPPQVIVYPVPNYGSMTEKAHDVMLVSCSLEYQFLQQRQLVAFELSSLSPQNQETPKPRRNV